MSQKTPYIGSTISLITKLDIRYQGVLYDVSSVDATISLAEVHSFGTEDRPTDNPLPGQDKLYEYIVFKASDIKELVVIETPKASSVLLGGLPDDPAIISYSKHPVANSFSPPLLKALQSTSANNTYSRHSTPIRNNGQGRIPNVAIRYDHRFSQFDGVPKSQERFFQNYRATSYSNEALMDGRPIRGQSMRPDLKFEKDYDFEAANVKFQELVLNKEEETKAATKTKDAFMAMVKSTLASEKDGEQTTEKLDAKKPFFDCFTSMTGIQEIEQKNKRGTNKQTFGDLASHSSNSYHGLPDARHQYNRQQQLRYSSNAPLQSNISADRFGK